MANDKVQAAGGPGARGIYVDGVKVVGARVVDADFGQTIDATYGAQEQAVLTKLVAALVAHGLIASA